MHVKRIVWTLLGHDKIQDVTDGQGIFVNVLGVLKTDDFFVFTNEGPGGVG